MRSSEVTMSRGADQLHIGLSLDEHRERLADGDAVVNRKHTNWVLMQIRQEARPRDQPASVEVSTRMLIGSPSNPPTSGVKL